MSINSPDIKKLYGKAAGKCSICKLDLFANDVHIGQMAHVIAKNESGPRGDEQLGAIGIHSYENLILLCANHHIEVDNNPLVYPVERLHYIKNEHENWIASCTNINEDKRVDGDVLRQVLPQLKLFNLIEYSTSLPESAPMDFVGISGTYNDLKIKNPGYLPFRDTQLNELFGNFLHAYDNIFSLINGHSPSGQSHYVGSDDNLYIFMCKRYLEHEYIVALSTAIESNVQPFVTATYNLITYIRSNYLVACPN